MVVFICFPLTTNKGYQHLFMYSLVLLAISFVTFVFTHFSLRSIPTCLFRVLYTCGLLIGHASTLLLRRREKIKMTDCTKCCRRCRATGTFTHKEKECIIKRTSTSENSSAASQEIKIHLPYNTDSISRCVQLLKRNESTRPSKTCVCPNVYRWVDG